MNFRGGHGGGLRGRGKNIIDSAAVDLTPLIDVTFQLLIFFLLIVAMAALMLHLRQRTMWNEIGSGA